MERLTIDSTLFVDNRVLFFTDRVLSIVFQRRSQSSIVFQRRWITIVNITDSNKPITKWMEIKEYFDFKDDVIYFEPPVDVAFTERRDDRIQNLIIYSNV